VPAAEAPTRYRVDDLQVDVERRRVARGDTELPVAGISFDLFLVLLRAAPTLVSIDELMRCVWPDVVVGPETVSQRVKILRQALNDDAEKPRYVAGVRGRGYCLIAQVTAMQPQDSEPRHAVPRSGRHWYLGASLVVVVLLAVAFFIRQPRHDTAIVDAKPGTSSPVSVPRTAVAVLPFANLTGNPNKDYLGDGIAEEVINTLTKVPGLKVPARTSSFAYKGRNADIRQIANDLGVGTILEGSVREAGTHIRITAQLINARDGLHIWSETYDRKFTDLFKLQDDLATAIVRALQINLNGATPQSITYSPPTPDVEAYDLYLQGTAMMQRAGPQSFDLAVQYFQQALIRDPRFARAYARMGSVKYLTAVIFGRHPKQDIAAAEQAARRALQLDPASSDAQEVLVSIAFFRGRVAEAVKYMRMPQRLNSNDGLEHMSDGAGLDMLGSLHQALEEQNKAHELAPASPPVASNRAVALVLLGQDAEAIKSAQLSEDLGTSHDNAGLEFAYEEAAFHTGRYADAATAARAALDMKNPEQARTAEVVKLVYEALADPGRKAAALAAGARLYPHASAVTMDAAPCLQSSYAYVLLGELDLAYQMANQCLDSRAPDALAFGVGNFRIFATELRPFRQDRRFQAFATRLGYMEAWMQYGPPDDCELKDSVLACH
jgi:TolB-like protein/DNA-binding winged helix-turn-helix (wHTH) protein